MRAKLSLPKSNESRSEEADRSSPVPDETERASTIPAHWQHGQLLDVRNTGADYLITAIGEEYDPRKPERSLRFSNPALCQEFVSKWYAREHFDPRAF